MNNLTILITVYALSSISATFMLVQAKVFEWLRVWARKRTTVLDCSLCAGFHVGYINGWWMLFIYLGIFPAWFIILNAALCVAILSFVSYLLIKKLN